MVGAGAEERVGAAEGSAAPSEPPAEPPAEPIPVLDPIPALVARLLSQRPSQVASMAVWDFDLTILSAHSFGQGIEARDVPARWRADVADLAFFRAFVQAALERGVRVGIASFGRSEVILAYMEHIFAGADPPPFTRGNIVTPSALGYEDGTCAPSASNPARAAAPPARNQPPPARRSSIEDGKAQMLDLLREQAGVSDRGSVMYYDDDAANVASCAAQGYGWAVHTPDGFTRALAAV